jgi:hypothetical protein
MKSINDILFNNQLLEADPSLTYDGEDCGDDTHQLDENGKKKQ